MKKQIELTCATCGAKFTDEADFITPGISGFVNTANGEKVRFLDPTEEHHCENCIKKALNVP